MIKRFLLRLLASAVVIFAVAYFSHGVLVNVHGSAWIALKAALALGLLNAFVKPVLKILTLPLTVVTLGLFSFVLNALMLWGVHFLVPGFVTVGFLHTLIAAILISVGTSLLGWIVAR